MEKRRSLRTLRILFLQKRFLYPPDSGGKIRTLNVIRHLAKWHDVKYLCNEQEADHHWRKQMCDLGVQLETVPWRETPRYSLLFYCDLAINLFSRFPYNVNKDYDARLRQRADEILILGQTDLVICDFVQMARNVVGLNAPASLLFQHNVESQIFKRHAWTDKGLLRRSYMWLQWKKMATFEGRAGKWFDRVVAVSNADRDRFAQTYGWQHVDVIDTSVDVDYFQPSDPCEESPGEMVFVGSMDWLPNIDGMIYFCDQIFPLIQHQRPNTTLKIVGRNPTAEIVSLGKRPGIEVTGSVDDTRPWLRKASLVVVPLRIGGGTRLKIPEALAMKKAVLSTALGAEGLPVVDGQHIMIRDAPQAFADQAVQLLASVESRRSLGECGWDLVQQRFSSESVARQFEAICQRAIGENHS